jgi:hypothetical protein
MEEQKQKVAGSRAAVVVSEESAEQAVDEFLAYYEIDLEGEEEATRAQLLRAKRRMVKGVMLGRLEFKLETDKRGNVEQIVYQNLAKPLGQGLAQFRYREISGKAKTAMKGTSSEDMSGRMQLLLGALSGTSASIVAEMTGVDYSLAESLCLLFLSV